MTPPNTFVNDTTADADEVNENFLQSDPWTRFANLIGLGNNGSGLIKFSSTIFQTAADYSTDAGATWTVDHTSGYGQVAGEDIAAASGANGISADQSDASTAFTANSGVTWAASSTQPGLTTINAVAINGSAAVVAGDDGANNSIYFSSDGGDNYAQSSTGPTVVVLTISMASATVGYAIDTSSNIWKTTDGGDNWVDTTDNLSTKGNTITTSADIFYSVSATLPNLAKYVNSTNTGTNLVTMNAVGGGQSSNVIESTNGDIVFVFWPDSTGGVPVQLTMFRYDGTNVFMKQIGLPTNDSSAGIFETGTRVIPSIVEVDDIIFINIQDNIIAVSIE